MAVKVYSAQTTGLNGNIIDIEADLSRGLYSFSIVGLPDKAVEESRERVSSAIKNSGYNAPQKSNQRVVVSLAPADLRKEGPLFDLGIALSYLLASRQINFDVEKKIFLGELALDGTLRPIKGVLTLVKAARENGFEEVFVPYENKGEGSLIKGIKVYGCKNLKEVVGHLDRRSDFTLKPEEGIENFGLFEKEKSFEIDFSDIKGQETAKRGLEIAAAGGHNILMVGPPGTGKTLLAKAFVSILPPLDFEEMLETTAIHSLAGILRGSFITTRPFRGPHHTSSYVSIVGGGIYPKPGEISLSHRGVLFLDEFPEFDRRVIEALRQPLEEGRVVVSRSKGTLDFPARFILVCAMNPCPCGNKGSMKPCLCSQGAIMRYERKLSGPILDRIDLHLEVGQIDYEKFSDDRRREESSEEIRKRVLKAREIQRERFKGSGLLTNSEMGVREIGKFISLSEDVKKILRNAAETFGFSGRVYHRIIKLSRTIADLEGEEQIKENHILEALQYRPKREE